jgi:long-chain acyl-CoA synthetase
MKNVSFSGNGLDLPDDRGLSAVLDAGVERCPDQAVLSRKTETGWQNVTYREFTNSVRSTAAALLAHGVAPGDRVAVLGRTRYEWVVADFAVLAIGAVTVPIYPTSSEHQIRHVLTDSGACWFFAETDEDRDRLRAAGAGETWLLPELHDWQVRGNDAELADRWGKVRADDLATIVYTSGTTGAPKGCLLTHRNMYASSANTVEQTGWLFHRAGEEPDAEQASTLLTLPLSHVFGRTILLSCLCAGTRTGLVTGVPELVAEWEAFRPTFLALVPYALEKIRKLSRRVVDPAAEDVAILAGAAQARGVPMDPAVAREHAALDESTFQQLRDSFGGRWRYVISGGASLDDTTAAFYRGIGVHILNCYGLTEAATAVTVNAPATNRMSTVGRPIPGTTVAIADDGEVLVRGRNVSPGYWPGEADRDAAGTAGERWLATGDLGELDSDGFLRITGRRKEILVTSGGKNVAPTPLEDRVRLHPLVSNCMVIGDGRSYVTAVVTLDAAALAPWAGQRGLDLTGDGWRDDPDLLAEIQTAVDDANTLVSRAESIRKFRVLAGDFTVDAGQLTPSMKLRRAAIEREFATDIAALY